MRRSPSWIQACGSRTSTLALGSDAHAAPLHKLPCEVGAYIAKFLELREVLTLESASSFWVQAAGEAVVWRTLLQQHFPEYMSDCLPGALPKESAANRHSCKVISSSTSCRKAGSVSSIPGPGAASCGPAIAVSMQQHLFMLLWTSRKPFLEPGWRAVSLGSKNEPQKLQAYKDAGSCTGQVAVLYDVYLKVLACSVKLERPGAYRVLLHAKLEDVHVHSPTSFSGRLQRHSPLSPGSCTSQGLGSSFSSIWDPARWRQLEQQHGSGRWFAVELGQLVASEPCSAELEINNLNVDWQSNIYLDKVQLVPTELLAWR